MGKNNAIQQDVLEAETDTGVQASHNPRNDRIEQLAANNHALMLSELQEEGGDNAAAENANAADTTATTTNNTEQNAPHLLSEEDLMHMQVKTKVDGVEEVHNVADVVKSFQKDSAASKRLEEVARQKADLDAREAAFAAKQAAVQSAATTAAASPSDNQDDIVGNVVNALYEGDEEKTKEALTQLLGQRAPAIAAQTVDTSAIANQVRQQMLTEQAMEDFGNTFKDIVADPYLAQVADTYLAKELQDGKELNVALTNAGEATRAWLKQKTIVPASSNTDDKLQRKANLDNLPEASAKNISQGAKTDGEEDASAIIKGMRQARGLPV